MSADPRSLIAALTDDDPQRTFSTLLPADGGLEQQWQSICDAAM